MSLTLPIHSSVPPGFHGKSFLIVLAGTINQGKGTAKVAFSFKYIVVVFSRTFLLLCQKMPNVVAKLMLLGLPFLT